MGSAAVAKYLRQRGVSGPWSLEGEAGRDFAGAVVIPALAEGDTLFATLESLRQNAPDLLKRFLVVVVINHRPDASVEEKEDNARTLNQLRRRSKDLAPMPMAWVDAASPGKELPAGEGVGLGRKIGFDLALERLDWRLKRPLLVALDADTLVEPDYLPTIASHFSQTPQEGAVIPFRHQAATTVQEQRAIERYEAFLRAHVLGLSLTGSPYAFHTVGSTMAFTASGYVRAGGMNRRQAGEDFYFLQQLAKVGGVAPLRGTVVHPSPRPSQRTPFGTGRRVAAQVAGEEGAVTFYHPECYVVLGRFLGRVGASWRSSSDALMEGLPPSLWGFLQENGLARAWERLQGNFSEREPFLRAFHGWFDGLKTLRAIHHLSAGPFPRGTAEEHLPVLLRRAGLEPVRGLSRQLALLRAEQGAFSGEEGPCPSQKVVVQS